MSKSKSQDKRVETQKKAKVEEPKQPSTEAQNAVGQGSVDAKPTLFSEFLAQCSSNERAVYAADHLRAVPAFRKFLENTPDSQLVSLMK